MAGGELGLTNRESVQDAFPPFGAKQGLVRVVCDSRQRDPVHGVQAIAVPGRRVAAVRPESRLDHGIIDLPGRLGQDVPLRRLGPSARSPPDRLTVYLKINYS